MSAPTRSALSPPLPRNRKASSARWTSTTRKQAPTLWATPTRTLGRKLYGDENQQPPSIVTDVAKELTEQIGGGTGTSARLPSQYSNTTPFSAIHSDEGKLRGDEVIKVLYTLLGMTHSSDTFQSPEHVHINTETTLVRQEQHHLLYSALAAPQNSKNTLDGIARDILNAFNSDKVGIYIFHQQLLPDGHWRTILTNPKRREIYLVDPLGAPFSTTETSQIQRAFATCKIINAKLHLQSDGHNCGIWAPWIGKEYAQYSLTEMTHDFPTYLRNEILTPRGQVGEITPGDPRRGVMNVRHCTNIRLRMRNVMNHNEVPDTTRQRHPKNTPSEPPPPLPPSNTNNTHSQHCYPFT